MKDKLLAQYKDRGDKIAALIAKLERANMDQTQADLFKKYKEKYAVYLTEMDKVVALACQNKNAEAYKLFISKVSSLLERCTNTIRDLSVYTGKKADKINKEQPEKCRDRHYLS